MEKVFLLTTMVSPTRTCMAKKQEPGRGQPPQNANETKKPRIGGRGSEDNGGDGGGKEQRTPTGKEVSNP